jgi:hypothetical protein
MVDAAFGAKLSQEMANQMVAYSSAGKMFNGTYSNVRVGMKQASRFVGNDRLYDLGMVSASMPADSSEEPDKSVSTRDFPGNFYFYQNGNENGKKYILVDPDPKFMQGILSKDKSGTMIYINSPILPGTKFSAKLLGIGGFTFLGQFALDYVPKMYSYTNCVWQIADIKQTVTENIWYTELTADCRPLSYITTSP